MKLHLDVANQIKKPTEKPSFVWSAAKPGCVGPISLASSFKENDKHKPIRKSQLSIEQFRKLIKMLEIN